MYAWAVDRVEDRVQWDLELDAPLPGEDPRAYVSEATAEAEGALFMAAMAQHAELTGD